MTATKTPRELIAECAEQLSADGHYELSLEIAALKAAQPVGEPGSAACWIDSNDLTQMREKGRGGIVWKHKQDGYEQTALYTQPAPAAPYQVTDEDVQTVLDVYWAPGNSTVNGETMRRALEAYEARKAAA